MPELVPNFSKVSGILKKKKSERTREKNVEIVPCFLSFIFSAPTDTRRFRQALTSIFNAQRTLIRTSILSLRSASIRPSTDSSRFVCENGCLGDEWTSLGDDSLMNSVIGPRSSKADYESLLVIEPTSHNVMYSFQYVVTSIVPGHSTDCVPNCASGTPKHPSIPDKAF